MGKTALKTDDHRQYSAFNGGGTGHTAQWWVPLSLRFKKVLDGEGKSQ